MTTHAENDVMLATEDRDLGIVPAATARQHAQDAANEEGKTVTLRHPETDEVIGTVEPTTPAPEAPKAKGRKAPANKRAKATKAKASVEANEIAADEAEQLSASVHPDQAERDHVTDLYRRSLGGDAEAGAELDRREALRAPKPSKKPTTPKAPKAPARAARKAADKASRAEVAKVKAERNAAKGQAPAPKAETGQGQGPPWHGGRNPQAGQPAEWSFARRA